MRNALAIGLWLSFSLASAAPAYPTLVLRCGDVIDARIVGGPIHVQLTAQKTKEFVAMRKPFVLRFAMPLPIRAPEFEVYTADAAGITFSKPRDMSYAGFINAITCMH
jgi:hypothetical protein